MRSPRHLLAASASILAFVAVWAQWMLFVGTYTGQKLEALALAGSYIGAHRVSSQARVLLSVISMPAAVILVVLILIVGLWRGARRRAIYAAATVVAINLSTQLVKRFLLPRPEYGFSVRYDGANTLPSGHTAMAASAAVALVLVSGTAWRAWAAWAGALVAAAMGYSTLVCQWHRPADVVAAMTLALAWGLAAVAVGAWDRDEDDLNRSAGRYAPLLRLGPLKPLAIVGGVALGVALGAETVVWWTASSQSSWILSFVAYLAGSAATVGTACLSMAFLALLSAVRLR